MGPCHICAVLLCAGWDVFTLRYTLEEPLATIIDDEAVGSYHSVARLLWALKRAEHSLSGAWLLLNGMERSLARMEAGGRSSRLVTPGACAYNLISAVLIVECALISAKRTP